MSTTAEESGMTDPVLVEAGKQIDTKMEELADLFSVMVNRYKELDSEVDGNEGALIVQLLQVWFRMMCPMIMDRVRPGWQEEVLHRIEIMMAQFESDESPFHH